MRFQEHLRPVEKAPVLNEIKDRHYLECNDKLSLHLILVSRSWMTADNPRLLPGMMNAPPLREGQTFMIGIIAALALSVLLWAGILTMGWALLR